MYCRQLEDVLGKADYSPGAGQFYFSTGGDCPSKGADRQAPCGVVAEFRVGDAMTDALQFCSWGAIGE